MGGRAAPEAAPGIWWMATMHHPGATLAQAIVKKVRYAVKMVAIFGATEDLSQILVARHFYPKITRPLP